MSKTNTVFQIIAITVGIFFLSVSYADEKCEMRLSKCPEDFNNQTIVVPKNVTSVASNFFVCMPENFIEDVAGGGGAPSIMFVIDHSTSMTGENSGSGNDIEGARFTVTKTLIDTIQNKYPNAEIGLIIFQEFLYLDTRNQPYAVALPDDYPFPSGYETQAYIPLMRLSNVLSNGQTSVQMIKELLATEKVAISGGRSEAIDLVYKPLFTSLPNTRGHTNINTAFDAAKYAMLSASNPKENQFIIFLSDGAATATAGNMDENEFQEGTNVPTTFTVYFVPKASDNVPQSIRRMTESISANNYSESNPLSNVWSIQASYESLLDILMNQAINPIFSLIKKKPTKLILNNVTYEGYSTADSSFLIPDLNLQDSITTFDLKINYTIRKDSSEETTDSLAHIKFDVLRSDVLPMSDGVLLSCSDTIYYEVSVSAPEAIASEKGPANGTIQFTRNSSDHGDLITYFRVSGTATPDADYQAITDSVIFTGDQKSVSYSIIPLVDSIEEGSETVDVMLLGSKPGRTIRYSVASSNRATVTINDHFIAQKIPDTLILAVTPNPLAVNENHVFEGSVSHYFDAIINSSKNRKNGMLIALFSSKQLEPLSTQPDIYGKALIYDALGNVVKNLSLKKANAFDPAYYGMLWDATNNNNRKVGGGIYYMKIKIKDIEGIERELSRKIGIKY